MSDREHERRLQKAWFEHKLAAEKQKNDVVQLVKEGKGDFVLLDTRDRAGYANGHVPGAIAFPLDEIDALAPTLAPEREYVTYCWNST